MNTEIIYIGTDPTTESVITQRRTSPNHEFDWDNVTILDKEPFFK